MADINELLERLQRLEDAFNAHCQEKAVCSAHVQTLAQMVTHLDHIVRGNGKEGLTTITARMDERLESVQECLSDLPGIMDKTIDTAVTAAISQLKMEKVEEKKPGQDSAVKWLTNNVLPYFVTGLFIIILQALWELAKIKLNAP